MNNFSGCSDCNQQQRLYDIFSRLERTSLTDLPAVIRKCATLLMAGGYTIIDTEKLEELEFQVGYYKEYNDPVNHPVTQRNLT